MESLSAKVIQQLEVIAEVKGGQAKYLARTILFQYDRHFPLVVSDLPQKSSGEVTTGSSENTETTTKMLVSPNPTDYNVNFDWSAWWVTGQKVEIEITDQLGSLIQVLKPLEGQTSMEWTTELVSGSLCNYRLLIDDEEVDYGQIIINK